MESRQQPREGTETTKLIESMPLDQPKFCPEKSKNYYDSAWNFDKSDPWLGCPVTFDYVPMTNPKPKKGKAPNQAYYFGWISPNEFAPTLVHLTGGPGYTSIAKGLDRYNPIRMNLKDKCFELNPASILDRYNLLYIECPIGAGYSIASSSTKVKSFDTLGENAVELFRGIFQKHPQLAKNDFFFNSESFAGLSTPTVIHFLVRDLEIKYKGAVLECPWFGPEQFNDYRNQKKYLIDKKMWNGGGHKCCCLGMMGLMQCLKRCKCINQQTWEDGAHLPWAFPCGPWVRPKKLVNRATGKNEYHGVCKYDPVNTTAKETFLMDAEVEYEVFLMITSDTFHQMIGAKKRSTGPTDFTHMDIMNHNQGFSSNKYVNEMLASGESLLVMSGEGDYIVPHDGIWQQLVSHWDIQNKEAFLEAKWEEREEFQGASKKSANFEFLKLYGVGHMIGGPFPELKTKYITDFLDKHY
jgi:hypothetical protein